MIERERTTAEGTPGEVTQWLRALRHAEDRQALADRIAWDLSQRPDVENAPGFILDFIYGSWSLVLASAGWVMADRRPA